MQTLLRPMRIKAPVTSGGFAARGSVVSPYYPRAWGAYKTTMTNVNAVVIQLQNDFPGNLYVSFAFYDGTNAYLGINTVQMAVSDIIANGINATVDTAIATLAATNSYTVLGIYWAVAQPISTGPTSYQTIVSQTGTAAPAVSGGFTPTSGYGATTFTWARTGAGVYTLTANAAVFSTSKTGVFITPPQNLNGSFRAVVTSSTVITVTTAVQSLAVLGLLGFTAVNTDALLNNTMIYVQTYS